MLGHTAQELARRHGVTPRRIQQMTAEGFFVRVSRGRYLTRREAQGLHEEPNETEGCPSCGASRTQQLSCRQTFADLPKDSPLEINALWFAAACLEEVQNLTEESARVWSLGLLTPEDVTAIGQAAILLARASREKDLGLNPDEAEDCEQVGEILLSKILDKRETRRDCRFVPERHLDWLRRYCQKTQRLG